MLDPTHTDAMALSVQVMQLETRNPHFHDDKGEDHVHGMRTQALNAIYHSQVCLPDVRAAIHDFLVAEGAIEQDGEPPVERVYPPVGVLAIVWFLLEQRKIM